MLQRMLLEALYLHLKHSFLFLSPRDNGYCSSRSKAAAEGINSRSSCPYIYSYSHCLLRFSSPSYHHTIIHIFSYQVIHHTRLQLPAIHHTRLQLPAIHHTHLQLPSNHQIFQFTWRKSDNTTINNQQLPTQPPTSTCASQP